MQRPEVPPGAQRDLVDALHALHHRAGWPSLRTLARRAGCSHTTIATVFSAPRLPSWGVLELLVEAMDGDVEEFHRLWLAASRPGSLPAPRLAGRRAELAAVRRHLLAGRGLLLVTGEAGIGKTRLVETACDTEDVVVARGAGLPLSCEVPFLPIIRVLQDLHRAALLDGALSATPAYVRGALASLLPELSPEPQPQDLGSSARWRLFSAVHQILAGVQGPSQDRHRAAVLLDDLHWADSDSLDLLEYLVGAGAAVPLVGTFRLDDPTVPDRVLAWGTRLRRLADVEVLDLPPLTRQETAEQIRLLPADGRISDAEADRIYAQSLGRPLFTEQLAVHPDVHLPRLLDEVLSRRVADLPDTEHQVAGALAVADRGLPVDVLTAATGLTPSALTRTLRDLDHRRLLADAGQREARNGLDTPQRPAGPVVALRHPLLAEAVRGRMVPGEAEEVHRRLARALEPGGEPAEVAAHWRGAGDPTRELGWRIAAAQAAQARLALAEEARQWQRALELWSDGGDLDEQAGVRRIDAIIGLLDALEYSGTTEQAWEAVQPVLGRVDHLPPLAAGEVLYRAAAYQTALEDGPVPVERAAAAVAAFETAPPGQGLVRALNQYSVCLVVDGRTEEAEDVDERVVATCREVADPMELRRALVISAAHLIDRAAPVSEIGELLDEARGITLPSPDPVGDTWLGTLETDLVLKFGGGLPALVAAAGPALAAADEWALDTFFTAVVRYNLALGWLRAGHVTEAAEIVDARTAGAVTHDRLSLHVIRVALDAVRGRSDDALGRLVEVIARLGVIRDDPEYNVVLTESEIWADSAAAAFERLSSSLDSQRGHDHQLIAGELQVLTVRAAADLAAQEPARRPALRREVARLLDRPDPTDIVSEARRAYRCARTAELARLASEPRPDLWTAAAREWARISRPFDSAYARWRGAQAALELDRVAVAASMLRAARREARGHVPLTAAITATGLAGAHGGE